MPMKRHRARASGLCVLLLCGLLLLGGPGPAQATIDSADAADRAPGRAAQPLASIAVNTSADAADGDVASFAALAAQPGLDGAVSLREALLASNAMTSTMPLAITFAIPTADPGYSATSKIWTITLGARALPPLAHGGVTIDGASQPGGAIDHPAIAIDGYNVYETPGRSNGLTITSADNVVHGLTLLNFYDDAILIEGAGAAFNQVAGCYLGLSATGSTARAASYFGIVVRGGAHDNLIGGARPADGNLIGGNDHSGILIQGAATTSNTVANNWIGLAAGGQARLGNRVAGVMVSGGARATLIGGAGQGNLISGNDTGIYLDGALDTMIAGNVIGLAADRTTPLGNSSGGIFVVHAAQGTRIGGAGAALRNIISGNGDAGSSFGQGIYISDANTSDTLIVGNYIGTDTSGVRPAGNFRQGILIAAGAQNNQIGGDAPGAANVIAYNGLGGIRIDAPHNQVRGNLIGVGADGRTQLGNQSNGVRVGGSNNVIGPNNLIAFNQHSGLLLLGSYTSVLSNTLRANGRSGICVAGPGATLDHNLIEQNGSGAGPWPECSIRSGVVITDTSDTLVSNNRILANSEAGVTINAGRANRILTNSISANTSVGIRLQNGANDGVGPPQIASAAATNVRGTSCPACRVEVFADTLDEGRYYLGATIASSDGGFQLSFGAGSAGAPYLTATQTDALGNTSPFATAVTLPAPVPTRPPGTLRRLFLPLVHR